MSFRRQFFRTRLELITKIRRLRELAVLSRCAQIKMAPTGPTQIHTALSIIDSSPWSWGPRQCLCWLLPPLFFYIRIKILSIELILLP